MSEPCEKPGTQVPAGVVEDWPLCRWCLQVMLSPVENLQTNDRYQDIYRIEEARAALAQGHTLFRINGQPGASLRADTIVNGDTVCVFHLHSSISKPLR